MTLFLEITDGQLKGTRSLVRDGLTLGRGENTLTIQDPKVSNKHAKIEQRSDGSFWLVDLGSSNQIKVPGGGRLLELRLDEGVTFILGRTPFQIIGAASLAEADDVAPAVEFTVTHSWRNTVLELTERAMKKKNPKKSIAPFLPMLRLKFIRGAQTGTEWLLGYGPRLVGSNTVELTLKDPTLPGLCFRLIPKTEGAVFQNESDAKLNGKWVESEFLHNGDVIEIKNTQIQVVFDEP